MAGSIRRGSAGVIGVLPNESVHVVRRGGGGLGRRGISNINLDPPDVRGSILQPGNAGSKTASPSFASSPMRTASSGVKTQRQNPVFGNLAMATSSASVLPASNSSGAIPTNPAGPAPIHVTRDVLNDLISPGNRSPWFEIANPQQPGLIPFQIYLRDPSLNLAAIESLFLFADEKDTFNAEALQTWRNQTHKVPGFLFFIMEVGKQLTAPFSPSATLFTKKSIRSSSAPTKGLSPAPIPASAFTADQRETLVTFIRSECPFQILDIEVFLQDTPAFIVKKLQAIAKTVELLKDKSPPDTNAIDVCLYELGISQSNNIADCLALIKLPGGKPVTYESLKDRHADLNDVWGLLLDQFGMPKLVSGLLTELILGNLNKGAIQILLDKVNEVLAKR